MYMFGVISLHVLQQKLQRPVGLRRIKKKTLQVFAGVANVTVEAV